MAQLVTFGYARVAKVWLSIQLGLLTVLSSVALAQSQPDVAGILKNLSATCKTVSQYELVMEITKTDSGTGQQGAVHSLIAVRAPDRYRVESPGSIGKDGKTSKGMTIVLDGAQRKGAGVRYLWTQLPCISSAPNDASKPRD